MPGSTSYRPGDILTSYSGKTIEIINTDAEGRLILADALSYACELDPKEVIDLATLTGACVVALGHYASGAFGDERIVQRLKEVGEATGDRAWPLPLYDEYGDDMKSEVADIKNSGGRWGGASTAAAFLRILREPRNRLGALDIAGNAWTTKTQPYHLWERRAQVCASSPVPRRRVSVRWRTANHRRPRRGWEQEDRSVELSEALRERTGSCADCGSGRASRWSLVRDPDLSLLDALQMTERCRDAALTLFPGKETAFELIYRPRFERVLYARWPHDMPDELGESFVLGEPGEG
jgi:hypothetical protein